MNVYRDLYAAMYPNGQVVSWEEGEAIGTPGDVEDALKYAFTARGQQIPSSIQFVKLKVDVQQIERSEMR